MKQNNYLKETIIDIEIDNKLNIYKACTFLEKISEIIGTKIISKSINKLGKGFDILIGIKSSCLYLGYWPEFNFVHIIISSCNNFNMKKVRNATIKFFNIKNNIVFNISSDETIEKKIKSLKNEKRRKF